MQLGMHKRTAMGRGVMRHVVQLACCCTLVQAGWFGLGKKQDSGKTFKHIGPQRLLGVEAASIGLEGTILDGNMIMKLQGTVPAPIANGTYDFRVMHLEDGQEIHYKGPFSLCCAFFDNSNCVWEGEYPNQIQVGGCPVPQGAWTATIKRPLWIRLPGTFRAVVTAYDAQGRTLESVQALGIFKDSPQDQPQDQPQLTDAKHSAALVSAVDGSQDQDGGGESQQTGLPALAGHRSGEDASGRAERAGAGTDIRETDGRGATIGNAQTSNEPWLLAGRNWTGTYASLSEDTCGSGCCCLHDPKAEMLWVEKTKAGVVRGTLSIKGLVREGSDNACKGLQRMHIRNFIIQRNDSNRAEKKYCTSACQTLVARRAIVSEKGGGGAKVRVSLSNNEHAKCGEQRLECVSGPCLAALDLSQLDFLHPAPTHAGADEL